MRRFVPFFFALLVLLGSVSGIQAQQDPLPEGVKVDKTVAKVVIKAAKDWIKLANKHDPAAAGLMTPAFRSAFLFTEDPSQFTTMLEAQVKAPIKVLNARNVRDLGDGRFSVSITYSGRLGKSWFLNERWVFVPIEGTYLLDGMFPDKKYVPKGMTDQAIEISVVNGGVVLNDGSTQLEKEATDVVFFKLTNQDPDLRFFGLFRLHKGVQAHSGVSLDDVDFIAPLILAPMEQFEFGHTIDAGNYMLVAIEPTRGGNPPVIIPGGQPITMVFTAPDESTPAGS